MCTQVRGHVQIASYGQNYQVSTQVSTMVIHTLWIIMSGRHDIIRQNSKDMIMYTT